MTTELRSIYSGPIRRALEGLAGRVMQLETTRFTYQASYQWKTDMTATDPLHGFAKANAVPASATVLYVSVYDHSGQLARQVIKLETNDDIYFYIADALLNSSIHYRVTAPVTLNANQWVTIPVAVVAVQGAFNPGNNTDVLLDIPVSLVELGK